MLLTGATRIKIKDIKTNGPCGSSKKHLKISILRRKANNSLLPAVDDVFIEEKSQSAIAAAIFYSGRANLGRRRPEIKDGGGNSRLGFFRDNNTIHRLQAG